MLPSLLEIGVWQWKFAEVCALWIFIKGNNISEEALLIPDAFFDEFRGEGYINPFFTGVVKSPSVFELDSGNFRSYWNGIISL